MSRVVRSTNSVRVYKKSTTPSLSDGAAVGDLWINTSLSPASFEVCTDAAVPTFAYPGIPGTWIGDIITGTYGGTGINNGSRTITIAGNVTFSGAFTFTGTVTANTSVTFPTSGTLVNSAVTSLGSLTTASALATVGTITSGTWTGGDVTSANVTASTTLTSTGTTRLTGGWLQHSVTTTATLTSTDFGKEMICTGASAYTITLPSVSGNAGKFIKFMFLPTSNAIVTLSPASGTIDGQSTLPYVSGESCTLYCDGTNWSQTHYKMMQYTMVAGATVTTSISTAGPDITIINLTASTDPSSWFSSNIFTPKYPGRWSVRAATLLPSAASGRYNTAIKKNSAIVFNGNMSPFVAGSDYIGSPVNCSISVNGSTDTISMGAYQTSGGTLNVYNDVTYTYMICKRESQY